MSVLAAVRSVELGAVLDRGLAQLGPGLRAGWAWVLVAGAVGAAVQATLPLVGGAVFDVASSGAWERLSGLSFGFVAAVLVQIVTCLFVGAGVMRRVEVGPFRAGLESAGPVLALVRAMAARVGLVVGVPALGAGFLLAQLGALAPERAVVGVLGVLALGLFAGAAALWLAVRQSVAWPLVVIGGLPAKEALLEAKRRGREQGLAVLGILSVTVGMGLLALGMVSAFAPRPEVLTLSPAQLADRWDELVQLQAILHAAGSMVLSLVSVFAATCLAALHHITAEG